MKGPGKAVKHQLSKINIGCPCCIIIKKNNYCVRIYDDGT